MNDLTITAAGPLTIDAGKAETVHIHNSGPTTIITNARRVEDLEWAMGKLDITLNKTAAENTSLRDRLAKTDATLMELCQLLGLDPTGDVVVEMKARLAVKVTPRAETQPFVDRVSEAADQVRQADEEARKRPHTTPGEALRAFAQHLDEWAEKIAADGFAAHKGHSRQAAVSQCAAMAHQWADEHLAP